MSAKLFALTVCFVLLAEILVLIPSISKERISWLTARIEAAYLVSIALEAPEAEMIKPATAEQLFTTANIQGVTVNRAGARFRIYTPDLDADETSIANFIDLNDISFTTMIADAFGSFFSTGNKQLSIKGAPMSANGETVDILVSQRALRLNLHKYARNILLISLVISTLTAILIYQTLTQQIVSPVKNLTRNMAAFENNPEDSDNLIKLSKRNDEIGDAEQGLRALELRIQSLLAEQKRLAALGSGISKISHDLRNILASAQLMSDRLAKSDDPRVKKLSPRLLSSLDRAITLSNDTVIYGKMGPDVLNKTSVNIHKLVEEVLDDTATMHVQFENHVTEGQMAHVDRNQYYRSIFNLVRNAVEALNPPAPDAPTDDRMRKITVSSTIEDGMLHVDIADNGPGLPETVLLHLFEPFKGSRKPGGAGLGGAIVHEIMRAHGGEAALIKSDEHGAAFRLSTPVDDKNA